MESGEKRFAGRDAQDKTIINQIMLRFRPIAPRPVNSDGTVAGKSVPEKLNKKRVKRKYVRVKKRKSSRLVRENNRGGGGEWLDDEAVAMIEDDRMDLPEIGSQKTLPCWIDFRSAKDLEVGFAREKDKELETTAAVVIRPAAKLVVESWITMESVTDTCGDSSRLGCTDEERMRYLEGDTCPGFISNSLDRVEWVNPAYWKMVEPAGGVGATSAEFVVSLVVREKFLLQWPAFSCRVRVVNNYCKEKEKEEAAAAAAKEMKTVRMTVPCDVWKMDFGGFAWRLDVEAALSLGR